MKLVVLADNRAVDAAYESEHGLSVYVATDNYKYLFDSGATGLFIRNAATAGVDLSEIDYVFISHGHSDHIGGLELLLKLNHKAKVVLSRNALDQKLYSKRNGFREIGRYLDVEKYSDRLLFVEDEPLLNDEVQVITLKTDSYAKPKANATLFKDAGEGIIADDFNHEIVVTIGTERLFVFTGCAHQGLLNMLQAVTKKTAKQISYVFGGAHLLDSNEFQQYETEEEIRSIANTLLQTYPNTTFFTGHCTGDLACRMLGELMPGKMSTFYTGMSLDLTVV